MKILLHIGMPKAGSTALQNGLLAADAGLRARGILYPAGEGLPNEHKLLLGGFLPYDRLPRRMRQAYRDRRDRVAEDVGTLCRRIERRIAASRAETLVLSSEALFRAFSATEAAPLRALLGRFGPGRITVVAYVRRPSAFYLSFQQQNLKAAATISPPAPVPYRREIESWEAVADDVVALPYEAEQLRDGDVVRDFVARFLPEALDLFPAGTSRRANVSMSAEGMDLLQLYRRHALAGRDGEFTGDAHRVQLALAEAEQALAGPAPRLLPHVADGIDRLSEDVLWLRDRFGVRFSGLDYDRVGAAPEMSPPPVRVADICPVDVDRREALLAAAMRVLAGGDAAARPRKVRSGLGPRKARRAGQAAGAAAQGRTGS